MSTGDRDTRDPAASDPQVRVAKISAYQAIAVALITTVGGGAIGYFAAGSNREPAPAPAQHWLMIEGIAGPLDQAVRIVASVNSVVYAYPADVPYTRIGINMPPQRLPLPVDADSYVIGFEAQIKVADAPEPAIARSRARPQFQARSLPRDKQQYDLHAVIGGEKQAEVALTVLYSFQ